MEQTSAHIPAIDRQLPADLYGRFDIKATSEGGRQYSLPHTLGATVLAIITGRRVLLSMIAIAVFWTVVFPERDTNSPLADRWIYAVLMFFPLHGAAALTVAIGALASGMRKITRITIREDGLIWNDSNFFAAHHIWMISYGVTENRDKETELFTPKIEIQVGTQTITLADGLDVAPAKLFMRLFAEDTRRYWHRHN